MSSCLSLIPLQFIKLFPLSPCRPGVRIRDSIKSAYTQLVKEPPSSHITILESPNSDQDYTGEEYTLSRSTSERESCRKK